MANLMIRTDSGIYSPPTPAKVSNPGRSLALESQNAVSPSDMSVLCQTVLT